MTALSIVVPCFNEQECIAALYERLTKAAKAAVGTDYEIVLVNDGSRDRTWPMMQDLAAADPRLVAVNLSRNHGHQLALTAGLDLCAGEDERYPTRRAPRCSTGPSPPTRTTRERSAG